MTAVAIIPARGGSKRIPRKNIKPFAGKPIIAYSIEAALSSGLFNQVMVSTDDDEIAAVAQEFGATVPFKRSAVRSNDHATTFDVIEEVLENFRGRNMTFDFGCCIYATAPFTTKEKLSAGFQMLVEGGFISVLPVVSFGSPIWRGLKKDDKGKLSMLWPEFQSARSQDLPKAYHDAGQWYWFSCNELLAERKLFTANSGCIELSSNEVQDIDTSEDWELAEIKYSRLFA